MYPCCNNHVFLKLVNRHFFWVGKLARIYLKGSTWRPTCKFVYLWGDCEFWHFKSTEWMAEATFFYKSVLRVANGDLNQLGSKFLVFTVLLDLTDLKFVLIHDLFDVVVQLWEGVGEGIGEVNFVVWLLEGVVEAEHVVFLAATHCSLHHTVIGWHVLRRIVAGAWCVGGQLWKLVDYIFACFDPAFVFESRLGSAFRELRLEWGYVEHRLDVDTHALHV